MIVVIISRELHCVKVISCSCYQHCVLLLSAVNGTCDLMQLLSAVDGTLCDIAISSKMHKVLYCY